MRRGRRAPLKGLALLRLPLGEPLKGSARDVIARLCGPLGKLARLVTCQRIGRRRRSGPRGLGGSVWRYYLALLPASFDALARYFGAAIEDIGAHGQTEESDVLAVPDLARGRREPGQGGRDIGTTHQCARQEQECKGDLHDGTIPQRHEALRAPTPAPPPVCI